MTLCSCFVPLPKIAKKIRDTRAGKDSELGPLKSLVEYLKEFKDALGDAQFLGGEEPGPVDVSLYGTMQTFRDQLAQIRDMTQKCGLDAWFHWYVQIVPLTRRRLNGRTGRTVNGTTSQGSVRVT